MAKENVKQGQISNRTILGWMKKILGKEKIDFSMLPDPEEVKIDGLIAKATGEPDEGENGEHEVDDTKTKEGEQKDNKPNALCCSYEVKRNTVLSLQEIRKFAEENQLAATMVKALLTILAEMALNALKGKVSGTVLAMLLNAINYESARKRAYEEGEIAGRNAKIVITHFSEEPEGDGLPALPGGRRNKPESNDIFSLAREAAKP